MPASITSRKETFSMINVDKELRSSAVRKCARVGLNLDGGFEQLVCAPLQNLFWSSVTHLPHNNPSIRRARSYFFASMMRRPVTVILFVGIQNVVCVTRLSVAAPHDCLFHAPVTSTNSPLLPFRGQVAMYRLVFGIAATGHSRRRTPALVC